MKKANSAKMSEDELTNSQKAKIMNWQSDDFLRPNENEEEAFTASQTDQILNWSSEDFNQPETAEPRDVQQ